MEKVRLIRESLGAAFAAKPQQGPEIQEAWITTYTGKKFHLLDPQQDEICIEDIAHALSMNCRFGGHCNQFYSVAEHSVHVCMLTQCLQGLMHDASEAYVADIVSPLKPHLKNYREIENKIMKAVALKFKFDWPMAADIKDADTAQLKEEAKFLLVNYSWVDGWPTERQVGIVPSCLSPAQAERLFLLYYDQYKGT